MESLHDRRDKTRKSLSDMSIGRRKNASLAIRAPGGCGVGSGRGTTH